MPRDGGTGNPAVSDPSMFWEVADLGGPAAPHPDAPLGEQLQAAPDHDPRVVGFAAVAEASMPAGGPLSHQVTNAAAGEQEAAAIRAAMENFRRHRRPAPPVAEGYVSASGDQHAPGIAEEMTAGMRVMPTGQGISAEGPGHPLADGPLDCSGQGLVHHQHHTILTEQPRLTPIAPHAMGSAMQTSYTDPEEEALAAQIAAMTAKLSRVKAAKQQVAQGGPPAVHAGTTPLLMIVRVFDKVSVW